MKRYLLILAVAAAAVSSGYATTYYARATGNWNAATTWSTAGCGGAAASSTPGAAAGDIAIICGGYTVTVTANPSNSLSGVTVQSGGYLICGGSGGSANKQFTMAAGGTFQIDNGGTYEHNTNNTASTTVFAGNESFGASSTFIVTSWSGTSASIVTGCGSNFGNLTLNYDPGAFFWNCEGLGSTCSVLGTLTIGANCTLYMNSTNGNYTANIANLNSSSSVSYVKYNSSGDVTLNMSGSATITAGIFYVLNQGSGNATMSCNAFTLTAGNFFGVTGGAGNFTMTTSGMTISSGLFRGCNGSLGAGNFVLTVNGNWNHNGGQLVGVNYQLDGNYGTTTCTVNGNLTLAAGSIIWHSSDITDGRTCAINITGNLSLTFASGSDFMEFNNITSLVLNNAVYSLTVGGNFTVTGSTSGLFSTRWTNTGQDNITITGNMGLAGGTTSFAGGTGGSPSYMPNNTMVGLIGGNVSMTGSAIFLTQSSNATSHLDLNIGTASTTWAQTTSGTVSLCNTNVLSGKTVTLTGSKMGDIQSGRTITVNSGGALYCSNYPVSGSGAFTLSSGATIGSGSAAGIVSSGASGNVQVTGTRTYNSGGTYEYYESITPQSTGNFTTTTTSATYPSQVANLVINKGNATDIVNLTNTTDVTTLMTLTKGILTTSTTAATAPWVRIPSTASVSPTGGSANSYVNGYIRKQGNTAFVFPTGNGGKWRRVEISAPSISTEFEARYVASAYANTSTMAASPTPALTHVSTVEHWYVSKPLGADAATSKVKLYWESASASGVYTFDSLTVARWSGSAWENTNCYSSCPANWLTSQPERTYTGSATGSSAGTIQSNTVSSFSPFTLGSIGSAAINPLPVELISNTAVCTGSNVVISWSTASETNNQYFTLARSLDGVNFSAIGIIQGAGTTSTVHHYSYTDRSPYTGVSYYRLSQTDMNGDHKDFPVITTNGCEESGTIINAYNDQAGMIAISIETNESRTYSVTLYDVVGKKIKTENVSAEKGHNNYSMDLDGVIPGLYLVRINDGKTAVTKKIFVN
jgi:hypothetical protein